MKMFKLIICVSAFLLTMSYAHAKDMAGITLPDVFETPKAKLVLNGAGIRTKFFLDLYVGGLYLVQKEQQPEKIIAADNPMVIKLHIVSSMITSKKMEAATREGFENATKNNIDVVIRLQPGKTDQLFR